MSEELTTTGAEMVRDLLASRKKEFGEVLNSEIAAKDFCRVALTMIQESPKLLQCTEASLYTSLLKAAQLQLNCDGLLGEAYLVPFNDNRQGLIAQLLIGYKGLINLAMNTGHYKDVRSRVVWTKDPFKISLGTNEFIEHEPSEFEEGAMRGCYAVAVGKDGTPTFEFMFSKKIWTHAKQYSKMWNAKKQIFYPDSIWVTNPEMAFKKTLIRKLCNRLPLSARVKALLAREDRMEAGLDMPLEDLDGVIDVDPLTPEVTDDKKPEGKKANLSDALKKKNGGQKAKKQAETAIKSDPKTKHPESEQEPPSHEEMEEAGEYQDLCVVIDNHLAGLYPGNDQMQEQHFQKIVADVKGPLDEGVYTYQDLTLDNLQTIWTKIQE